MLNWVENAFAHCYTSITSQLFLLLASVFLTIWSTSYPAAYSFWLLAIYIIQEKSSMLLCTRENGPNAFEIVCKHYDFNCAITWLLNGNGFLSSTFDNNSTALSPCAMCSRHGVPTRDIWIKKMEHIWLEVNLGRPEPSIYQLISSWNHISQSVNVIINHTTLQ